MLTSRPFSRKVVAHTWKNKYSFMCSHQSNIFTLYHIDQPIKISGIFNQKQIKFWFLTTDTLLDFLPGILSYSCARLLSFPSKRFLHTREHITAAFCYKCSSSLTKTIFTHEVETQQLLHFACTFSAYRRFLVKKGFFSSLFFKNSGKAVLTLVHNGSTTYFLHEEATAVATSQS